MIFGFATLLFKSHCNLDEVVNINWDGRFPHLLPTAGIEHTVLKRMWLWNL